MSPVYYDLDEPQSDVCKDCETPATCGLYERCMRTDEFIGQDEGEEP